MSDTYEEADILRFLGLAARASKVVSGNDMLIDEIKRGKVQLVLIAQDISRNTLDRFLIEVSRSEFASPVAYRFATKYKLGNAIGKPDRALVGVIDEGFANKLGLMLDRFEYKEEQN